MIAVQPVAVPATVVTHDVTETSMAKCSARCSERKYMRDIVVKTCQDDPSNSLWARPSERSVMSDARRLITRRFDRAALGRRPRVTDSRRFWMVNEGACI